MKLTNYIRDAFVRAAMADVPKVDYEEQIVAKVNSLAAVVRKIHHVDKAENCRLNTRYVYFLGSMRNVVVFGLTDAEATTIRKHPEMEKLLDLLAQQEQARNTLDSKLHGIASGCTTRKQLVELLPEFEKYLPAVVSKTANLPAVSNVVGEFIRAGWPKNKPQAAQATT